MRQKITPKVNKRNNISMSTLMTCLVVGIVFITSVIALLVFVKIFHDSMEQNAVTSSEQAVVQVKNTVTDYTEDMQEIMKKISTNMNHDEHDRNEFIKNLLKIRSDVVAITTYNSSGKLIGCWSNGYFLKDKVVTNLSYVAADAENTDIHISSPHVETLFRQYYPWVVTISQKMQKEDYNEILVCMDIRFSNIANYVDDVGIGQHGYCFIMDDEGKIIYHPQQQLIFSGLKEEDTQNLWNLPDGSHTISNVIYNIHSLENCGWRIVGVTYVDETVTGKVKNVIYMLILLFVIVVITAVVAGLSFSYLFTKPVNRLSKSMGEFEQEAKSFSFQTVRGMSEIESLSDSFGHMVLKIQQLMEKVRQEEISLRKTELNALQAQINPHFLYNTLDSIAWMCEEERNKEAVDMVNALARLFRISISKGHELIPIEKELQHAESYLKIQKFRYKSHFDYMFHVEEGCLKYLCNKITLQPIIENAIVHGLDMEDYGLITICVHEKGETIILVVEDNGVGMQQEFCDELIHKDSGDKSGIGIKNVNDRIKIYFGEQYGIKIYSELDKGTKVEISIPKILTEEILDAR